MTVKFIFFDFMPQILINKYKRSRLKAAVWQPKARIINYLVRERLYFIMYNPGRGFSIFFLQILIFITQILF